MDFGYGHEVRGENNFNPPTGVAAGTALDAIYAGCAFVGECLVFLLDDGKDPQRPDFESVDDLQAGFLESLAQVLTRKRFSVG